MKASPILHAILASVALATPPFAHGKPNALALPSEIYILSDQQTDLYTQPFVRRWHPDTEYVRVKGNCDFVRRLPQVTTISHATDGTQLHFSLIEGDGFTTTDCDSLTIRVGQIDPTRTSTVTVQIVGDSYVQGAFYKAALIDSAYVSGIRTVGLRKVIDGGDNFDEGRGGWRLSTYFTISKGPNTPYAGFMQPQGDMRYIGATAFWRNCHRVMSGELSDFESRYQCGRYEHLASQFDPKTGRKLNPKKHDLMYDNDTEAYILFDGRRWRTCTDIDESTWDFDYGKYLKIWDIPSPDFLFETLGLNDFRSALEADYTQWDAQLTRMKESYLKAVPGGKFIIVIPCSTCGSLQNRRGDFTLRENACMWEFRRHLIDTFDHRTAEGYWIVDMGITIDNDGGYRTDHEGLQTGNPHPYPNYPTMGRPLAAFIQYHRK